MKQMLQMIAVAVLGLSATITNAATVFTANNEDVDFIVPNGLNFTLAVFDNEADLNSGTNPLTVTLDDLIPGTLRVGEAAVGTGNSFVVGISGDNGVSWFSDSGYTGGSTGIITYTVSGIDINFMLVDVDVQVVPVPAATWLFGSGLLGLVAVARRRA